jgi:hypothetical protein
MKEKKKRRQENDAHQIEPARITASKDTKETTFQGTTLPAHRTTRRNKTSTKHFPEQHAEQRR